MILILGGITAFNRKMVIKMNALNFIGLIGINTIWVTPLTFTMGIIYSIKKPEKESTPYKIIAVISAYLIIFTFMFCMITKS
jgi:hypothetical protein